MRRKPGKCESCGKKRRYRAMVYIDKRQEHYGGGSGTNMFANVCSVCLRRYLKEATT